MICFFDLLLGSEGEKQEKAKTLLSGVPGLSLPYVKHAAGFEKYSAVAAGGCAHEAGYDAYMTGVAFANLVPLMLAKDTRLAAESPSSATSTGLAGLALNSPTKASETVKQKPGRMQSDIQDSDATKAESARLLAPVASYRSRLNVMRTDMPYTALEGPDPVLVRPNVFHVSGLPGGGRLDEIVRLFQVSPVLLRCMTASPHGDS